MYCTICRNPKSPEIVEDWAYSGSLRFTAAKYRVGYRSLQRHIDLCLASVLSEKENLEYEDAFDDNARLLRWCFAVKMRKRRPKSIITKPVKFTWSRRAWKTDNKIRTITFKA